MDYRTITVDRHPDDDRLTRILLSRPDEANLVTRRMLDELTDAVVAADRDDEVRGMLLGSTDPPFCSGASLEELRDLPWEEGARWLTAYFDTLDLLRDTGKPIIAGVEGTCVAGGNELVSACDIIVAGESTRFGQPEVGVGSTAAGGGVQLLPLMVGEKRAKDLLLTGRLLDAEEAKAIGLITRVVPDGEAEDRARELLTMIADEKSPQAYRTIKAIMKPWTNFGLLGQEMARDLTARTWDSEEFRERTDAFLGHEEQSPRRFHGTQPRESDERGE